MTDDLVPDLQTVPLPAQTHAPEWCSNDKAKAIVTGPKGYPQAAAVDIGDENWQVVDQDTATVISDQEPNPQAAWENALFKLTQLNADLLYQRWVSEEGHLEMSFPGSWFFWFQAQACLGGDEQSC